MKEFTSIITPQCEVSIPDEVRRALGVELGDAVRFTIDDGKVSLSSVDKSSKADAKPPFRVKPNNSGFVEGVDHLHLNRLIDELAVEDFIAKNS